MVYQLYLIFTIANVDFPKDKLKNGWQALVGLLSGIAGARSMLTGALYPILVQPVTRLQVLAAGKVIWGGARATNLHSRQRAAQIAAQIWVQRAQPASTKNGRRQRNTRARKPIRWRHHKRWTKQKGLFHGRCRCTEGRMGVRQMESC